MATNTAASFTNHTGNGTAGPFSISFSYLSEAEVDVTVGGVLKTITTHYTFTSATQITFTSGNEPANGAVIKFQRDTNVGSKKVDFVNGSVLTESDLDTQNDQLLFAVQEITDNFVKKDGSQVVTGDLVFEGSVDDTNETTLAITNPTADRTITLPDTTGTVVTTGDTGTVTSTMINDGTIVNADINASAAIAGSKLQAASSSNAGSMSASDKSKLDAIESGATGNQSNSEIKTAYEANSDTNAFTDAEKTKLSGIEASATADQTNSEIKTAYEANSDTNAFTDAEKTKLSGIATGAEVNVQSDFNATSGDAVILNKPTIPSALNDLSDVNTTGAADGKILKFQSSSNTFIIADDANDGGGGGGGSLTDGDKGDITVSSSGASWSIDASAVSTNKIADDAVTSAKIAAGAVGTTEINANAVVTDSINASAVTSAKIADDAVTSGKIADDAVTRDKINAVSTSSLPSFEAKGTSGSTEGYIQLNCAENSHGIKLKSPPHSAAASYTFTFPQNIQNGQFLTTDASGNTSWSAIDLTALSASNLTSGTVPDARFPATLPAASGTNLTNLPSANLTGALPAISGASLTSLNASNLGSGTIPDARFPATLPAASAANLTAIPAANITGTLPAIDGSNLTGISTTPADGSITQAKLNFPVANRNLIINGNFSINQRGGVNTSINTYALDRWRSYGGPLGFTISQQNNASNGSLSSSRNAIRVARNSGNSQTSNTGIAQGVETLSCQGIAGTQMTLSFFARKGADFSSTNLKYLIFFGQGTDDNPVGMTSQTDSTSTTTLATTFTKYTKTVTVPANTSQITVAFSFDPTGTAGSNDWFEIAECQLERGSVATDFEHRPYGQELALARRYYLGNVGSGLFGVGRTTNASTMWSIQFPTEMRVNPSMSLTSTTVTISEPNAANFDVTSATISDAHGGTTSKAFYLNGTMSVSPGDNLFLTTNYLKFDAEL